MELHDRLKRKRKELGLTQEELAKRMGYKSRVSINKIEMGRPISQKIIVKLAEALNTTPSYLMGWEEEQPIKNQADTFQPISNNKELTSHLTEWIDFEEATKFSDEEFREIMNFAKYIVSKRKK